MLYNAPMSFKTNLVQARKALKLTQKQLGDALDVTDSAVSQWERGEAVPELDKIPLLAKELKKPVGWFFDGADVIDPTTRAIIRILEGKPDRELKTALRLLEAHFDDSSQ